MNVAKLDVRDRPSMKCFAWLQGRQLCARVTDGQARPGGDLSPPLGRTAGLGSTMKLSKRARDVWSEIVIFWGVVDSLSVTCASVTISTIETVNAFEEVHVK